MKKKIEACIAHLPHMYMYNVLRCVVSIEYESRQPQLFLVFDPVNRI